MSSVRLDGLEITTGDLPDGVPAGLAVRGERTVLVLPREAEDLVDALARLPQQRTD